MNYTSTSSQISLADARKYVGQQIGLPLSYDGSDAATRALSGDQLVHLTRSLLDFIKNNPSRFTNKQVATANAEAGRFNSFDQAQAKADSVTLFGELANQAEEKIGKPLAAVGQGVSTSLTLAGNLLPILLIGAVVLIAIPYINRARNS